jgi:hypothetical protein
LRDIELSFLAEINDSMMYEGGCLVSSESPDLELAVIGEVFSGANHSVKSTGVPPS